MFLVAKNAPSESVEIRDSIASAGGDKSMDSRDMDNVRPYVQRERKGEYPHGLLLEPTNCSDPNARR